MLVAKGHDRLIPVGCRKVHLHFERRNAVESSFRGPSATFHTHEPFGQNFLQLLYHHMLWKKPLCGLLHEGGIFNDVQ